MTKTIWTGTCIALVGMATAAVTAQTPAPPQSGSATADQKIVVTGCLKPAPSSPTDTTAAAGTVGTTGAAGTAATTAAAGAAGTTGAAGTVGTAGTTGVTPASDAKFVLANAMSAAAETTGATSPTTAASTPGASASAATQTYRLIANSAALAPLVGKKLELTGTLDKDTASEASAAPALRVTSGKIIAASCSE